MRLNEGIRWRVLVMLPLLLMLLAAYYRTRPADSGLGNPALPPLAGALLDILTAALVASVGGGLGRRITSRLDLTALSRPERLALEGALGLGILSVGALALGMAGLFRGVAFWVMLAALALILRRDILGWLSDGREALRGLSPDTAWGKFLAALVGLLLAAALLIALAPPSAWDALAYHLVAVKIYLAESRITTHAENAFLGFPQQIELLYGLAVGLVGRDTAAAPLHFWFGLMGLMAAGGLARRLTDTATGWLTALLLLGADSLWRLFGWPYVDLAVMTYGALALVVFISWREKRAAGADADSWLMLMGLCAGLALGVKYTAGLLLAALVVAVFVLTARASLRGAFRSAVIITGVALAVFLAWMLKGLILYHNPIFPFLFNGPNWDSIRSATFSLSGQGLLGTPNAWQLAVLPLAAGILGVEGGATYSFTAGPWLLIAPLLLPLVWAWVDPPGRRLALNCLALIVPIWLFWIFTTAVSGLGGQTRLVMMALPAAAVLGALFFRAAADGPYRDLRIILRVTLAITLLIGLADPLRFMISQAAPGYFLGDLSRDEALSADLAAYYSAMQQLSTLPTGSQVRLMWEPRSYYCPANVTCLPDIAFDHWSHPLKTGQMPDDVFAGWKAAGENYLLVWQSGYELAANDPQAAAENAQFPGALARWMTPVWSDGVRYTLYTWK